MIAATFPDWHFDLDETRMGWYNINATRFTGNVIGINGTDENGGLRKIVSDIVDFELKQNRTFLYWNEVFAEILTSSGICISNSIKFRNTKDNFQSWRITISDMEIHLDNSEPEINLYKNEEKIFSIKWPEFNGAGFLKIVDKINIASKNGDKN